MGPGELQDPLLDIEENVTTIPTHLTRHDSDIYKNKSRRKWIAITLCLFLCLVGVSGFIFSRQVVRLEIKSNDRESVVTSEYGVVAADHETCSDIGVEVLGRPGATAVDAAVAVAFCLGVVNPTSSGIGGGAFMVVGSPDGSAMAYDMRETAPLAASKDMTKEEATAGPLSIGVPGEIAGLYKAWDTHGYIRWEQLVKPSIKLARDGFKVGPHLEYALNTSASKIMNDAGLKSVFTKEDGSLMKEGDTCYNRKLADTLEAVAKNKAKGFYEGDVAEKLVNDLIEAKGILTKEDLLGYEVNNTTAMVVDDVMGYKIQGMWPPSSGTPGFAMVMNVLAEYINGYATDENLGLHRVIESIKYMLVDRMDLGDPAFVDGIDNVVKKMVSKEHAKVIHGKISDSRTFPPEHYHSKYKQLEDQGTSHFCVVDKDRNVVSMTTTVNFAFGSGYMSPSTGIILNNQMADFSIPEKPTEDPPKTLPPAPANFIERKKRPLSSMMPLIIRKDNELVGVLGASGGANIIPALIQVFLNHFILNMSPLDAVKSPRIYHKLIPNEVLYEDWEVYSKEHIKLSDETQTFLEGKGHVLKPTRVGATVQFVVQNRQGVLTAVSDLRKGGKPAVAHAPPTL